MCMSIKKLEKAIKASDEDLEVVDVSFHNNGTFTIEIAIGSSQQPELLDWFRGKFVRKEPVDSDFDLKITVGNSVLHYDAVFSGHTQR